MIQPHPTALILITPLLLCLGMALYVVTQKKNRPSMLFLLVIASISVYTFALMFEQMSTRLDMMIWWLRIQYIGIAFLPVFWVMLILNRKTHPLINTVLLLVPAAVLTIVWTTPFHYTFFSSVHAEFNGKFYTLITQQGIGYWLFTGFITACFVFSAFWTFFRRRNMSHADKNGLIVLHIATILPLLPYGLTLLNISLPYDINSAPYILSISAFLVAVALFRFELFHITPVARMRLIEALKDPFIVIDVNHFVADVNSGFEALCREKGIENKLVGMNAFELYDRLALTDELRRQSFDKPVDWQLGHRYFEFESYPVMKGRMMTGIIHYFHDYTARKNYEQQLRQSLLRLEKLNDLSRVLSMWMGKGDMTQVTIKTATELLNSVFGALYFLESGGLHERARTGIDRKVDSDAPITALFEEAAFEAITQADTVSFSRSPYHVLSVPLNAEILHGQPGAIVFIKSEDAEFSNFDKSIAESVARQLAVTVENARLYREVERRAQIDGLTSMFTRRHFESLAKHEFSYALRHKRPFCVIMADIDHFKKVNDTHGHPAGDAVLRQFAERLRVNVRDADILGRYGGEEFIILLPATKHETAMSVAERVHSAVGSKTMSIGTGELSVTASFGMSEFNFKEDKGLETVIKRADTALYEAKNSGRNCIKFK
ncbi:MAG: diguanylate cyclase [Spirochaetales bacterium]|nr:diguanylate cyclase [Spirochaetales bacterium]